MKVFRSLEQAVGEAAGSERKILSRTRVFGGDINDAFRLTLDDGTELFMKTNEIGMLPAFLAEAAGLSAIAGTGKIGTARVLGVGTDGIDPEESDAGGGCDSGGGSMDSRNAASSAGGGFSFLLQEWIAPGRKIREYWETLGAELCAMHSAPIPEADRKGFGFFQDNYIGAGKQINIWKRNWIDFYRECRLVPQLRRAERYLDKKDRNCAMSLLDHLDNYLVEPSRPSLIHGDLWAGNVMTGSDGRAWIIDPAAYYGHPEADLAMTELFGGFSQAFYAAYFACADLPAGYADRKDLYNLYHLLNHLNLFGTGYLSEVRRILRRY